MHALDKVLLDDRHVLVGRRVIDALRAIGADDFADAVEVVRVAEQRHDFNAELLALVDDLQLPLDLVEGDLAHLQQQQAPGTQRENLAAELGADRAAGSGDEHALAADTGTQQAIVRRDGRATQEVGNVDLADVLQAGLARQQRQDVRHGLHVKAGALQAGDDLAPPVQ